MPVTLFGDWDFMELYQGTLELEDLPDFLVEIRDAASLEEMKALLEKAYQERKERKKDLDLGFKPSTPNL